MAKLKTSKKFSTTFLTGLICFTAGCLTTYYTPKISSMISGAFSIPKISVVMSTYNRDHAIGGAIESILNQTMEDFELIVINDGSTDDTQKILEDYANKDKRLVVIKNERNMGLVAGLNKGLDAAKGKYIARMDDDDKSLPHRLERQFLAMEENPHITVLGGGFGGGTEKKRTGKPQIKDPNEIELNTYFNSGLAHPTIMIRKNFLDKNNIKYDEKYLYAEDCGLYKKILEHGGKISSLEEPVLIFGHVKKVKKPTNYAFTQAESFKKLQKDKLSPFFEAPYEILGAFNGDINRCIMLKEMVKVNKKKKILDQTTVEKRFNKICPKENEDAIFVSHPNWGAFVIYDKAKKNIRRKDVPSEKAKILDQSENHITVKWEKYPKMESFIKDENGFYVYSNKPFNEISDTTTIYNITHPLWSDQIIVLKDQSFYRVNVPEETGKILNETKATLTIKWTKWPAIELFRKDKNNLNFIKELKK
ncbi:MAG: glycosyltransferase family 2 protein [Alphaproteobacteria bacterium]|nr:glycosyltransferase family 2 protein [Alphaproteobacteria bacterium]